VDRQIIDLAELVEPPHSALVLPAEPVVLLVAHMAGVVLEPLVTVVMAVMVATELVFVFHLIQELLVAAVALVAAQLIFPEVA
jgi:hypothetical protein